MIQKLAKVRPYYKYEMAQLYKISRPIFMEWIEDITEVLEKTGYSNYQHIFTLKQTEIIFNWLGHPPANNNSEILNEKRVFIIPYTKSELADIYNISSKTLLSQIESIPNKLVKTIIMDGNDPEIYIKKKDKKLFKTKEVKLIFKYLGHPYL